MPADWTSSNPLCDVQKSQDVACVYRRSETGARTQETEMHNVPLEQVGEDCFFFPFSELSQFLISSPFEFN